MGLFLEESEIFKFAYSYYSTILTFRLNEYELARLKKCMKNIKTFDKNLRREVKIKVYIADEITEIYAIPHFMAFINFASIENEDKQALFEFWKECEEPLPPESAEYEYDLKDLKNPITYILNYHEKPEYNISDIYFNDNILNDSEKLRLTILSVVKDNEGIGRRACESSIRLRRVLLIYKCLLRGKILTKQKVDEICYPDIVSKRMFYRDISIINEIEDGKVVFDRNLKGYILRE